MGWFRLRDSPQGVFEKFRARLDEHGQRVDWILVETGRPGYFIETPNTLVVKERYVNDALAAFPLARMIPWAD